MMMKDIMLSNALFNFKDLKREKNANKIDGENMDSTVGFLHKRFAG